jgi:hypothetical protein
LQIKIPIGFVRKFLYKLYYKRCSNRWFDLKYQHLLIRSINYYYEFICKLTSSAALPLTEVTPRYLVSLTTFPARIEKVWLTIESILQQKHKPGAIILWLYKGEFNGKSSLPKKLLDLEKRGLQIRFCEENLMPHKKYFYAMKEFSDATVITIDDDIIYPTDLLSKLIDVNKKYPDAICCSIARHINNGRTVMIPYDHWNDITNTTLPRNDLLAIGAGGTLFPPGSLNNELFNLVVLKERALKADDLWLKTMSLLNKTKIVCIAGAYHRFPVPVIQKNNQRLMDGNILQGQNDKVINELMQYYHIPVSAFETQ